MWKFFDRSMAKKKRIYLDYASATPVLGDAARAVADAQRLFGNPGSIHAEGVAAARLLKESREKIARELGAKAREIVFVSGGTELAALLDVSRTLARKVERRVIAGVEDGDVKVGAETLAYLNRLSSLFYALARLTNHKSGIKEVPPSYE